MWLQILVVGLAIGAVVAAIRFAPMGRTLFRIRVRRRHIELRGRVPGHASGQVIAFVRDLDLPVGAQVRGVPDGSRFRLELSPLVPPDAAQRLRNFLLLRI